jgi:Flp pilus assembly pilin Flp
MMSPTRDATGQPTRLALSRRSRRSRRSQARGAVMTEYTVIVGVVALACVGAFVLLGVALVSSFEARRDLILYPSP